MLVLVIVSLRVFPLHVSAHLRSPVLSVWGLALLIMPRCCCCFYLPVVCYQTYSAHLELSSLLAWSGAFCLHIWPGRGMSTSIDSPWALQGLLGSAVLI